MKKNITINLYGTLYAIDEDAFELLNDYENNLKSHFSKVEGGDEIVDDIERRIAELFDELKANGVQAITIDHVKNIICRIGNPEDMDDKEFNETSSETESSKADRGPSKTVVSKKLFRDPNDQMLGGVMAGFAHYFGGDPLLWRLMIILLCFLTSFLLLIAYLVCWLIIPKAVTVEDFLLMTGKEVTIDTISQTVVDNQKQDAPKQYGAFERFMGLVIGVLKVVLYIIGIILAFVAVLVLLAIVIMATIGIVGYVNGGNVLAVFYDYDQTLLDALPLSTSLNYCGILICSAFMCAIPLYCFVHHILSRVHKTVPMKAGQRIWWIVAFLLSCVLLSLAANRMDRNLNGVSHADTWTRQHVFHGNKDVCLAKLDSLGMAVWDDADEKYESSIAFKNVSPGKYHLLFKALNCDYDARVVVEVNDMVIKKEISDNESMPRVLSARFYNNIPTVTVKNIKIEEPSDVICTIEAMPEWDEDDDESLCFAHSREIQLVKVRDEQGHYVTSSDTLKQTIP